MKIETKSKKDGFSANSLIIPLVVILVFLHVLIISLIAEVNRSTNELSDMMQRLGKYQSEANGLQAGTMLLSETATGFVMMPVLEDGSLNVGPLSSYANEFVSDRSGQKVAERFHKFDVNRATVEFIDIAAKRAESIVNIQLHAISLLRSVYKLPDNPAFSNIPEIPLTESELAMSKQERVTFAKSLLLSSNYGQYKYYLNENISKCTTALREDFAAAAAQTGKHVAIVRISIWAVMGVIILIMFITFFFLYRWILRPLRSYANIITADDKIEKKSGVKELRQVVSAYNGLLRRRNKLESILRYVAETDTLTGLPNRYCMERNVLENNEEESSMAVLLFDVNFLKRVNDTEGHLAGDRLLKKTGECIRESFGDDTNTNCYRIGGDEFAAILRGCTEEEIKGRTEHFKRAIEREDISVSVGYGFSETTDENSFKKLMKTADKYMYESKREVHNRDSEE